MTATEKVTSVKTKLAAKETALNKCSEKIANCRELEKVLKKEIHALQIALNFAELEELGDFLKERGISFSDIQSAVSSGIIAGSVIPDEVMGETEKQENCATNSTENEEEDIDEVQISGDGEDIGDE